MYSIYSPLTPFIFSILQPKKPKAAFFFFASHMRKKIQNENPDLTFGQITTVSAGMAQQHPQSTTIFFTIYYFFIYRWCQTSSRNFPPRNAQCGKKKQRQTGNAMRKKWPNTPPPRTNRTRMNRRKRRRRKIRRPQRMLVQRTPTLVTKCVKPWRRKIPTWVLPKSTKCLGNGGNN